jgi:hypothetical protein
MSRSPIRGYLATVFLFAFLMPLTWSSSASGQQNGNGAPQSGATHAKISSAAASSLCPLLIVGVGLFVASCVGFWASVVLERASRSAVHIAKAARATLITALVVVLIYSVSVSYLVLSR